MPQDEIQPLTTENAVQDGGKKVRPQDPIDIYGSAKSKHLDTGAKYSVHKELADKLVKKGEAHYEAPKSKGKAKGGAEGEGSEDDTNKGEGDDL